MSKRQVIILWVVALVLALAIAIIKYVQRPQSALLHNKSGQLVIDQFPAKDVTTIDILGVDSRTTLVHKEGKWTIAQRADFAADTKLVNGLLRAVSEMKITQVVEAGPSFSARFGMDESAKTAANRGTRIYFKDQNGKDLASLTVGKFLESNGKEITLGRAGAGRYVRNHENQSAFYAVGEMFDTLSSEPQRWLAPSSITVGNIKSIAVEPSQKGEAWKAARKEANTPFLSEKAPDQPVNPSLQKAFASMLAPVHFEDVLTNSEAAARKLPGKDRVVTIETFDGVIYKFSLSPAKPLAQAAGGKAEQQIEETFLMTVEASGSGEAVQGIINQVKSYAGRTYEVSKFTVAPLLITPEELIKKPDPQQPASGSLLQGLPAGSLQVPPAGNVPTE